MQILVLDTIHGGEEIARFLAAMDHSVEAVDVYRGTGHPHQARYDMIIAPVHLDPRHPALAIPADRVITHHEAVAWILWDSIPHPMVEITGAKGKTTTAHALAFLMKGPGILHTSTGTYRYPGQTLLWRRSITPASVLPAAMAACEMGGWLIAEESLGVTGAGDLAVLTSSGDYPIAAGTGSGLAAKVRLLGLAPIAVVPPDLTNPPEHAVPVDEVTSCVGTTCSFAWAGREGSFANPLLALEGYRIPLQLAAAAACLLGIDPSPLGRFPALEGRMSLSQEGGIVVMDNANSGTDRATTQEAARYARKAARSDTLTLVIGEMDRTVCEGFPKDEIEKTIQEVRPNRVVLVGEGIAISGYEVAKTLEEGLRIARTVTTEGSIVLAVKMWR
jgi:hypothetical protein